MSDDRDFSRSSTSLYTDLMYDMLTRHHRRPSIREQLRPRRPSEWDKVRGRMLAHRAREAWLRWKASDTGLQASPYLSGANLTPSPELLAAYSPRLECAAGTATDRDGGGEK